MADTPPQDTAPTAPVVLTDGLSQQVMKLTQQAAGNVEQKGSMWPLYVIITAVIVIGLAIMGWLMVSARRKAAELAYELRKKEEEQKEAAENHTLQTDQDVRDAAQARIKDLGDDIAQLKKELKDREDEAVARAATFAKIASWDDIIIVDKRQP